MMSAPQGHAWRKGLSERQTLTEAEGEAEGEQTNAATTLMRFLFDTSISGKTSATD